MELKKDFPTSFLKPAEYNPRIMEEKEHEQLEEVINYFGLADPIIFNTKTGVIIGGNQRYEHIKNRKEGYALLLGDIGWYFTDEELKLETEADEKSLNIALNKISGSFDNSLLIPMMEEILITDTPLIGFDDEELNSFLDVDLDVDWGDEKLGEKEVGEYNKYDLHTKTNTFYLKEGDEWNIGNHKFIVGHVYEDSEKINMSVKGSDLKITVSSAENVDEEMYLFMSKNKEVIKDNKPDYGE